jgi:hypothetical protein
VDDLEEIAAEDAASFERRAEMRGPYGKLRKAGDRPRTHTYDDTSAADPSSDEIEILAGFISKLLGKS